MKSVGTEKAGERTGRQRILFVAEAATLYHMARPVVLARALDPACYDVHLACDPRYLSLFRNLPFRVHPIHSISSETFRDRLAKGKPFYDAGTLRSYVRQELELIEAIKPRIIVGDMRFSLSVSARVAGIPYVTIANAHWSPYAKQRYPVPELALTKRLGRRLGQALFSLLHPVLLGQYVLPLYRVKREYGLRPIGPSLPRLCTDADHVLYADLPDVVPTFNRPDHHQYIGPILWSHECALPSWWEDLPGDRPRVFVTLGSSGQYDTLPVLLDALAGLPVVTVAATNGRMAIRHRAKHVWIAESLPAKLVARRSDLVICNGGSATAYQALAEGVPVLGIPSNLDQYLTITYLQKAGVAEVVRGGDVTVPAVQRAVSGILRSPRYKQQAEWVRRRIAEAGAEGQFVDFLAKRFPETAAT